MADKKKEKNPVIACIIALVMGGHFIYKGIKYTMIDMTTSGTTSGVLLTICGVVLVAVSIFMFFKKLKKKNE